MRRPWEVSAEDIVHWAARYDTPAVLPTLVRRLLFATTPLDALEMRADAGVRLPGWDGIVAARDGSAFCPPGTSAWEFSVERRVKAKLDEDFEKRTMAPPAPVVPKFTTYVAVTAQRYPHKERWVREKAARKVWAGVRLLDADDLAAWLEAAPAVARWFAGVLGKRSGDVTDLETFLDAWSKRTNPQLPWELVLGGPEREEQARQLARWLTYPVGRPLYVRAGQVEEAVLFAAAAIARGARSEGWQARALIAETEDAWRWALSAQTAELLIVVPAFAGADPGRAVGKAYAILPLERSAPAVTEGMLDLKAIPYPALKAALVKAGREQREAEDLVQRAGGSLAALQRLCGGASLPVWVRGHRAELLAFLLSGAWTPRSKADREALQRLGADPEVLEGACVDLEKRDVVALVTDSRMISPAYRWRSHEAAWRDLAPGVTAAYLQRFYAVATDVLGAPDPAYDMPKDQRFFAAVQGRVLHHSGALREGLAVTTIRIALSAEIPQGQIIADNVVRRLLGDKQGWKRWASLSPLLPLLAEASPTAFLDAIETSLNEGDEGVSHMLAEEPGFGRGAAPHTALLWALEMLGWSPDVPTVRRVARALARLAECDPGGELSNRPKHSLVEMLHPGTPQSNTSAAERLRILKDLFAAHSAVPWGVAHDIVGGLGDMRMVMLAHRPQYRQWHPEVIREDVREQVEGIIDLMLAEAGRDAARWASLIEPARHMPDYLEDRVLNALESAASYIRDPEAIIWHTLRNRRCLQYRGDRGATSQRHAQLARMYETFKPADLIAQVAWLFGPFPDLPDPVEGEFNVDKKRSKLTELEDEEVAKLWSDDDRWRLFAGLADVVRNPFLLGFTLGRAPFADEVEPRLFDHLADPRLAKVLPGFAGYWTYNRHEKGFSWLTGRLRDLLTQQRGDDAAAITLPLHQTAHLWDLIDEIGEPLRTAYWQRLEHVFADRPEDKLRAIKTLLSVGRETLALQAASWAREALPSDMALLVLERLAQRVSAVASEDEARALRQKIEDYDVKQVFGILDRDPSVDAGRALQAEIRLLPFLAPVPFLEDSERKPKYLSAALGNDPDFFVQLLEWGYLREGESPPPEGEERVLRKQQVQRAHYFIEAWRGWPGEGLSEDEREAHIEAWATHVLDRAAILGRRDPATSRVAEILSRAPAGSDGAWPCIAARRLLEKGTHEGLSDDLQTAKWNERGWTSRRPTEGGQQERALADQHRADAAKLQDEWPCTAAMLDALARTYEREAEGHDAEARPRRIEYGDAPELAPAAAPVSPASTGTARFVSRIQTKHLAPAPDLDLTLGRRLNLLVGDNSLGKTFLLDVMWWALTGHWATEYAKPARPKKAKSGNRRSEGPTIIAVAGKRRIESRYDALHERWPVPSGRGMAPGLAIYARVDGGFFAWDPIRNASPAIPEGLDLSQGYRFPTLDALWERTVDRGTVLCRGFSDDAVAWRNDRRDALLALEEALKVLSPPGQEIRFGRPARFGESRDLPTLLMPNGQIFARHASAAIKRVLSLAYVLVWSISEIRRAAPVAGQDPLRRVTLLIDEVEAHLHTRWQRVVLPALLGVVRKLAPQAKAQLVVTTHSPLVLASMETRFKSERDALFHFALSTEPGGGQMDWTKVRWGEADAWVRNRTVRSGKVDRSSARSAGRRRAP